MPRVVGLDPVTKKIVEIPTEEAQVDKFKDEFSKKGKPSIEKYNPDMMLIAIELSSRGCGPAEIAKACGVTTSTLYKWAATKEDFGSCWQVCKNLYLSWWEKLGREASEGKIKGFNPYTYAFQMKNRFRNDGWSDTVDNKHSFEDEAPTDIDPTKGQLGAIKALMDKKLAS